MLESKSSPSSVFQCQLFIASSKQNVSHPLYKQRGFKERQKLNYPQMNPSGLH